MLYLRLNLWPDGLESDQIYRAAQQILQEELEIHVPVEGG